MKKTTRHTCALLKNKIKRYKIAATEAAAAKIQCIYCGSGCFVGAQQ